MTDTEEAPPIVLNVDIRESEQTIGELRFGLKKHGIDIKLGMFEISDFFVDERLGIEHKRPSDFRGSVFDGRIFSQAAELRQAFKKSAIVVSADMNAVVHGRGERYDPAGMYGAVAALVSEGTPVLFVGEDGLSNMVAYLVRRVISGKVHDYTPLRMEPQAKHYAHAAISMFPGIGEEKAKRIYSHFGSMERAFASIDSWTEVDGIGPKTVVKAKALWSGHDV